MIKKHENLVKKVKVSIFLPWLQYSLCTSHFSRLFLCPKNMTEAKKFKHEDFSQLEFEICVDFQEVNKSNISFLYNMFGNKQK